MCGVIGVKIKDSDNVDKYLIQKLFVQTMIRGKHATGVTFVRDGKLHTIKESIPADQFIKKYDVSEWIDSDNSITLIGHIRYSTSDLRYNQPFANDEMSIVHNGVISQKPVEEWEYETETANDSEMILRAWEGGKHPFDAFRNGSMAVCSVTKDKKLIGLRNHERPLWYTKIDKGIVFTSTQDIAHRSNLFNPQKCKMFTEYEFNNVLVEKQYGHSQIRDLQ